MREHATALADAVEGALPGWVERSVARRLGDPDGGAVEPEWVSEAATAAGHRARAEIGPRVRALLEADIDEQPTTPLALLRAAVSYPTEVLAAAGVTPVARDEAQIRLFPDDVYDLAPATFADVAPELADPGLAWGVAKAWTHRRRHATAPRGLLDPAGPLTEQRQP
ncbi:MAG TPA: hypothetical protein VHS52_03665 [Acidimicrobiales bacterium]|nr:hypothetical protein [Acidimicrobiales bacterium]